MFAVLRFLLLVISLNAVYSQVNAVGLHEILPQELLHAIQGGHPPLIIDTREADIYQREHIPSAINIIPEDIRKQLDRIQPYKEREIIVYCGDGTRSARAMTILRNEGFTQVLNLNGNFNKWKRGNLPTETGADMHQH